ncbi:MAG: hypothetical protein HKN39_07800 [Flavobacteriales bacterium]|nr:hypothetical protein [Flavobacteriales bacterium]
MTLFFLIMTSITISGIAQTDSQIYKWSPTDKAKSSYPYMLVGGDDNKVVSIFKERRRIISVRSYSYDTMEEKVYDTFELREGMVIDEELFDSFFLDDKVYLFIDHYNYKERDHSIYVRTLDLTSNTLSDPKLVHNIDKIKSNRRSSFMVGLCNDSTHFLVVAQDAFVRKSNTSFTGLYLDNELEAVWKKNFSLPYGAAFTEIEQLTADNEGNMHLSLEVAPEKNFNETEFRDRADRKFVLFSYFWKENKIKETDIDLADKWVAELTFDISEKNEVVVSGFYSNDRYNSVAGSFYLRLNANDLKIQASGLNPLDPKVVSALIGTKKAEKGREVPRMHLQHIIVHKEGGATLVGEQYWIRERNEYSINGGYYTRQIYYYMDLVVVKYNADGSVNWATAIPKRQESINDNGEFSSIAIANRNDELFIVFNDNARNMELIGEGSENLRNFNTMRSDPAYVSLDAEGNVSKQSPFKDTKGNFVLRPREFIQCSKDHMIILASRNGNERFCLFELVK